MNRPYRPQSYWSERLARSFDLQATGHVAYSQGYNEWLYRAKGRALDGCLSGIPTGTAALDVGSGVGWVVRRLLGRGFQVDGCDIAPVAVEQLAARIPAASFFSLDLGREEIPRSDGTYGVVTALDVTYHITDDALWLAGMTEIARVLKPGGRLIVSDGLGDADREPAPHVRFRSAGTWNEVERLGLKLSEVRPYFRWLSRNPGARGFRHLGGRPRGAIEYALERLVPRKPHMRCAVIVKRPFG